MAGVRHVLIITAAILICVCAASESWAQDCLLCGQDRNNPIHAKTIDGKKVKGHAFTLDQATARDAGRRLSEVLANRGIEAIPATATQPAVLAPTAESPFFPDRLHEALRDASAELINFHGVVAATTVHTETTVTFVGSGPFFALEANKRAFFVNHSDASATMRGQDSSMLAVASTGGLQGDRALVLVHGRNCWGEAYGGDALRQGGRGSAYVTGDGSKARAKGGNGKGTNGAETARNASGGNAFAWINGDARSIAHATGGTGLNGGYGGDADAYATEGVADAFAGDSEGTLGTMQAWGGWAQARTRGSAVAKGGKGGPVARADALAGATAGRTVGGRGGNATAHGGLKGVRAIGGQGGDASGLGTRAGNGGNAFAFAPEGASPFQAKEGLAGRATDDAAPGTDGKAEPKVTRR